MFIFKILLYLAIAIFFVAIVGFAGMALFWPQARKEDYLLSHGYCCEKGYWYKDDRSLAGSIVYAMNYQRLVDYVDRREEL